MLVPEPLCKARSSPLLETDMGSHINQLETSMVSLDREEKFALKNTMENRKIRRRRYNESIVSISLERIVMKISKMLVIGLLFLIPLEAQAIGRRRSRSYTSASVSVGSNLAHAISHPLQTVAQQRADAMARQGILSHSIGGCPSWTGLGVTEGIGCSTASDPKSVATCITGSVVVADAHARGSNGMIYRVRFFR